MIQETILTVRRRLDSGSGATAVTAASDIKVERTLGGGGEATPLWDARAAKLH